MVAWGLFMPACFALNMAPGPNNMAAFAAGAQAGFTTALAGGTGRLPAFAFLILLTAIGLGAALAASATAFAVIKFLGAAYLVYVGIKMWTAPVADAALGAELRARDLARRDFLIAIGNPKAIAIFTAFFPQFLDTAAPVAGQLLQMGAGFLLLEFVAVAIYAAGGALLGRLFHVARVARALNKGVGAFLVVSGVSLATARH